MIHPRYGEDGASAPASHAPAGRVVSHQKMSRLLQLQVTLVILHLHTSNMMFCATSYHGNISV